LLAAVHSSVRERLERLPHSGPHAETARWIPESGRSPAGGAQSFREEPLDDPYHQNTLSGHLRARFDENSLHIDRTRNDIIPTDTDRSLGKSERFQSTLGPAWTIRYLTRKDALASNQSRTGSGFFRSYNRLALFGIILKGTIEASWRGRSSFDYWCVDSVS
jgi:hypothetical protein